MPAPFDVLVLDAHLRQSLVAVRALGRRGLSVAALAPSDAAPAFSSRWCRARFVCPAPEGSDAYAAYLEDVLAAPGARVVLPAADGTVAALRRHRARLQTRTRLAIAGEAALGLAVDTERTLAVARRLGIAVPPTCRLRTAADLGGALAQIGLPAVIKPSESWLTCGGRGVRIGPRLVTTPQEARRAAGEVTRRGGLGLYQPLLSGRPEAVSLLYAGGRVHARFAQWAGATEPPDIGEQAERLVRVVDLEGYSDVEFRRDERGTPYLMEITPRPSARLEIAVRANVDFPHLLYQWACGGDLTPTPPIRGLLGVGASFFRSLGNDSVDWTDPRPALEATRRFAHDWMRAALGKRRGWPRRSPA